MYCKQYIHAYVHVCTGLLLILFNIVIIERVLKKSVVYLLHLFTYFAIKVTEPIVTQLMENNICKIKYVLLGNTKCSILHAETFGFKRRLLVFSLITDV